MTVLYIMVPAALLLAVSAIVVFVRAAASGQFDDLETPAVRMLPDDDDVDSANRAPRSVSH